MALPGAVAPSRAPLTLVFSSVESHHRSRVYEQRRRESLVLLDKTEKKRNETEELLQSIDARLQELDQESKELKAYQVRRSPPPPPPPPPAAVVSQPECAAPVPATRI